MATHYPGPDIVVTDRAVVLLGPEPITIRLDQLSNPRVVHGELSPAGVLTTRLAILSVVAAVSAWPLVGTPGRLVATFVVAMKFPR